VETITIDIDRVHFRVGYLDGFWVVILVEAALDIESGVRAGRSDQLDDDLVADQRFAAPVLCDEGTEVLSTWRRRGKAAAGAAVTRVHINPRGQHRWHRTKWRRLDHAQPSTHWQTGNDGGAGNGWGSGYGLRATAGPAEMI
jgi:hypothetical protein